MTELTYQRLSNDQIAAALITVPGWRVDDSGSLMRLFEFKTYADGVLVAMGITRLAEQLNHHPELFIGYGKVRVELATHDADGGLTAYDFELARRINRLAD